MNRISAERRILNLTQKDLAKMVEVDPSTVVRWESDETIPSTKLIKLRSIFNCNIDWILGLTDERKPIA